MEDAEVVLIRGTSMVVEFLTKNSVVFILLLACIAGLIGISLYHHRHHRKHDGVMLQLIRFLLWSAIVVVLGNYATTLHEDVRWNILTPGMIDIICASIIAIMFVHKMFLTIDMLGRKQIAKGSDVTNTRIISRVLKISLVTAIILLYGEHFGMSFSGLLTFGGIGGLAVGMAGKDILSNFFSGVMLYFDRPFNIGDWIRSPDRPIEGVVSEIGWRLTKITTFDNRPLYIPNSLFNDISVENPGRMTNRRIKTTLGLRYEDSDKIKVIVDEIRTLLKNDADIDHRQTLLVNFNGFGDSSLNIMVYCFTHTTVWAEWLEIQQRLFLSFIEIVHRHEADFAFPSRTLYIDSDDAPATSPVH